MKVELRLSWYFSIDTPPDLSSFIGSGHSVLRSVQGLPKSPRAARWRKGVRFKGLQQHEREREGLHRCCAVKTAGELVSKAVKKQLLLFAEMARAWPEIAA